MASTRPRLRGKAVQLWSALVAGRHETVVKTEPGDRRFSSKAWSENSYFDYLRQSYLLASRYVEELVEQAELEPGEGAHALRGPAVDRRDEPGEFRRHQSRRRSSRRSRPSGESLTRGIANLLADIAQGPHLDDRRGARSRSAATSRVTPGRGDLRERADPADPVRAAHRARSHERPLVMVPPCINKFYILDLQPENSLRALCGGAGPHGVHGVVAQHRRRSSATSPGTTTSSRASSRAIDVAREITGSDQVNALGFCVGGTLLGAALAVLARARRDAASRASRCSPRCSISRTRARSALFIDEASVAAREAAHRQRRHHAGQELACAFSCLRANDLIWPYVVNNYLKGKAPPAFDLLYWNADSDQPARARCTAGTCATPISRTSCASRAR